MRSDLIRSELFLAPFSLLVIRFIEFAKFEKPHGSFDKNLESNKENFAL